jgi:large subunit ribosomal protein L29
MPGTQKQFRDEIRGLSDADLRKRVTELQEEQFRLKFRSATETLEQPLRLRTVRRDIARCLTVLREREIGAAGEQQTPKARRRANRRADPRPAGATSAAAKSAQ